MPNCKITFLTPAWRDLDRISDYHLRMVGPQSAEKITDKLLDAIGQLAQFPRMGSEHSDPVLARQQFRKLLCGEYICVYKVIGDTVFIYRIVHGATDYPKLFK